MFENAIKIKNVCPEFKKSTERTNTNKSGRFQRNLGSQLPDEKAISIIKKFAQFQTPCGKKSHFIPHTFGIREKLAKWSVQYRI